jgi:hypothetical protein
LRFARENYEHDHYQKQIESRLGKIVSEDEHLKDIATGLEELIDKKSLDK